MTNNLIFILLVSFIAVFSVYKRKLTTPAAGAGVLVALSLYAGCGLPGVFLLGCFFVAGTLTTSWKYNRKSRLGVAEENSGRRDVLQVFANGGVPGLLALIGLLIPGYRESVLLLVASALSAATADTVSSELGSLYGKRFVNILTLKKDIRGENGVISLQGTLYGVAGSCLIAVVYGITGLWQWNHLLIILIAGTVGNLCDSILGATFERQGKIGNNTVNLLNTCCGAFTALLLYVM